MNGIFHRIFHWFSIELAAIRIDLSVPGGFSPGDLLLRSSCWKIKDWAIWWILGCAACGSRMMEDISMRTWCFMDTFWFQNWYFMVFHCGCDQWLQRSQQSAVTDYRCTVVFYDIFKDIFWSWLVLVWAFRTKDFPSTCFKYMTNMFQFHAHLGNSGVSSCGSIGPVDIRLYK